MHWGIPDKLHSPSVEHPYPLLLTKDGLEGTEALPAAIQVTAERQQFDPKGDNGKVIAHELHIGDQVLTQSPVLAEAVKTLRRAAEEAGKTLWMIGDGAKLRAQGFTFLCVGEPIEALTAALARMNREAKEA